LAPNLLGSSGIGLNDDASATNSSAISFTKKAMRRFPHGTGYGSVARNLKRPVR